MAGVRRHPRRRGPARARRNRRRGRDQRAGARRAADHGRGDGAILARRIIPCLDVQGGQVVKGLRFRDHRVAGDILELAVRYRDEGADEVVFYDITASPEGRTLGRSWVTRVALRLDIPFCVAGGIRSVADAEALLACGAEKVSVNSPALERPALVDELALRFGSQCVVVGIDSRGEPGRWQVHQYAGDPGRVRDTGRRTLDWIGEVQDRGAGEVVLNCMDRDGARDGFDIAQLAAARAGCRVPLVASGGAGSPGDFADVFRQAGVDAALAAGAFHDGSIRIPALKQRLRDDGIAVRP